jgi:aerobic-type carbon monoxide dehydrogenase small subunit (CoxS/CutS family)
MVEKVSIALVVNGRPVQALVEPRLTLADFLRQKLDLTGTHLGCEHGVCGACTVLLDGRSARACLLLAAQLGGHDVTTVEGLSPESGLSVLQQCFRKHHALQCGFCTPGLLVTAHALLQENACPSTEEIRDTISGNLCRCTGYVPIVAAIEEAAARMAPSAAPMRSDSKGTPP